MTYKKTGIEALSAKVTDIENLRPSILAEIAHARPAQLSLLLSEVSNIHHECERWMVELKERIRKMPADGRAF